MTKKKINAVVKKKQDNLPVKTPMPPEERKRLEALVSASYATGGAENAACVLDIFHATSLAGGQDFKSLVKTIEASTKKVQAGDMSDVEAMLMSQAHALQGMFANMVRRAGASNQIPTIELYMKFALRAQNQCRMTLETLANIKNPPVVYARQANIAQGHQQVNNGFPGQTRAREEKTIEANEVSGGNHVKALESGATGKTITGCTQVETVEAVNRPKDRSRKKSIVP